jgi:hypothetical protein
MLSPKSRYIHTTFCLPPQKQQTVTEESKHVRRMRKEQLIIPWVRRSGAANRVPFLQRTRPRHAQPGEGSPTHKMRPAY